MSRRERILLTQGGYFVLTGLAPFASRRWFEAATGPKEDWWLVETVGAATLAAIDVAYVARGRIAKTYLVDAAIEGALLIGLAISRERPPAAHATAAS